MKNLSKVALLLLVLSLGLVGCGDTAGTTVETEAGETAGIYTAGTYEGTAEGYGGEVKVEVTVNENEIESVTVLENSETEQIAGPAIEELPAAIVEAQSTDVDSVSGASVTSEAIKSAVQVALDEAKN